jgi:cytosine/adenosine deaminase-related metal-dependent hydrolase
LVEHEGTILAHGVHLTKEEMTLIRERGSKVSHCPASNSALGHLFLSEVHTVREDGTVGKEASLVVDVSITGRLWEQSPP